MVRERGQLLLIASVLIATTILGSVVLLNSIHASADVNAYQEKQSLSQAEQEVGEVEDSLRELFLVKDSVGEAGKPLPYVRDRTAFEQFVGTYTSAQNNLSTLAGSGVVSAELADIKDGMVLRHKRPAESNEESFEIDGADDWEINIPAGGDIPYVYLNVTSLGNFGMEFNGSYRIQFTSSGEVFADKGGTTQVCNDQFSTPFEVELKDSTVEIRSDDNICHFTYATGTQTEFKFLSPGSVDGQFTIVTRGQSSKVENANPGNDPDADAFGEGTGNSVKVVPTFTVEYIDPNIGLESDITIYGGYYDSG
jgi:hypothetical protein